MSIEHIIADRNVIVDKCVKHLKGLQYQLAMFFIDSACAPHDGVFDLSKHAFNTAKAHADKVMHCGNARIVLNMVDADVQRKYQLQVDRANSCITPSAFDEAREFLNDCIVKRSRYDVTIGAYSSWLIDNDPVIITLALLMTNVKEMITFNEYKSFDFLEIENKLVKLAESTLYGLSYVFLNANRRRPALVDYRHMVRQIDIDDCNDYQLLELEGADEGYITQLAEQRLDEGRAVTTLRLMNEYVSGLRHVKPAMISYDGLRVEPTYKGRMPFLKLATQSTTGAVLNANAVVNDQLKMRIACFQSQKHHQDTINGSFLHITRAIINDTFMILLNGFIRNDSADHKREDIAWEHLVYIVITR